METDKLVQKISVRKTHLGCIYTTASIYNVKLNRLETHITLEAPELKLSARPDVEVVKGSSVRRWSASQSRR